MKKHGTVVASLLLLALIIGTIGCGGEEITPSPTPKPTTTPPYTPTPVPTATPTLFNITFVTPTPTPFSITLVTPTLTPFSITLVTPTPTPFSITMATPTPTTIEFDGGGMIPVELIGVEYSDYIYVAEEFELMIIVPDHLTLSTPDDRKPQPVDLYMKKKEPGQLRGLFDNSFFEVSVEVGICFKFPDVSLNIFLDVDLEILGIRKPDIIRLEYPILGLPSQAVGLEAGDVGAYSFAVPTKPPRGDFESLSIGEWNHIGSYNIYAVSEPSVVALGIPLEEITIGKVVSLE